jgi:rhodanese-related sulfurtransferase/DNA-binding transcriptional ArsR family regulator
MRVLDHRRFRDQIFAQFARLGKAMASPKRLELIDLLAQAERSVEELARLTETSVANVSRHLQVLRGARMVEVRREGLFAYYRLADERVLRIWASMRELGEARLTELEQVLRTLRTDRADPVSASELESRLGDPRVLVLDVRPREEHRAGHIPGALSVPVSDLEALLSRLPRDREWIAYCRGPYSVDSDEAVALMRKRGFNARRLAVGLPEWRAAGLPVEGAAQR